MRNLFFFSILLAGVPARAYDSIRFLEPIRVEGMAKPVAAAASAARLYVVDEKRPALLVFDAAGVLLKAAGRKGSDKEGLSSPRGAAVGPDGKVYVADTGNHRIKVYSADGEPLWSFGTRGSERGMLKDPQSVAVAPDGRVYVADTGNDRVQVFTAEGILLFVLGFSGKEPGRFSEPVRVAVDAADNITVLDRGRIQQTGTPLELYERPANRFVAGFIGQMNFLPARIEEQSLCLGNVRLPLDPATVTQRGSGREVLVGIRPEHLELVPESGLPGTVELIEALGAETFLHLSTPLGPTPTPLVARGPGSTCKHLGERVYVAPCATKIHLFDPEDGRSLRLPG